MTTPEHESPAPQPPAPEFRDRVHRSSGGIAGGVLLLAIVAWLGFDALFTGHGRTPWLALAAMILIVPPVVAFTLRPAVYANDERLRIRNPFRVIVLPWGQVAALRSGYSNEVIAKSGTKYQLWAVPVSMRARKRAARQQARATGTGPGERTTDRPPRPLSSGLGGQGAGPAGAAGPTVPVRAATDQIMADLRELHETREHKETAQGEVTVRWAYEIAGPTVAGAVLLAILLAVG
ncbi:PH domain-containing protein [Streptomyces sp. NPDC001848]|uniref:PH domain-containing protein n=1 Tax=Streptomyces sp. NPDC001848 TaxID=3364618 RepID=UPI0036BBFE41